MRPTHRTLLATNVLLIATLLSFQTTTVAQDADSTATDTDTASIHDELRDLRDRMYAAYEKRDMETLLKDVSDGVVITWQNGERNVSHEEFLAFYDRMMNGNNPIVKDMSSKFEVDDLSILYGDDTAIAHGTLEDTFLFTDGNELTLPSKWTATVINENNQWKVASFHVSSNIFDNPILGVAKNWLIRVGTGSGIVGLFIGLIIGRISKKTK